MIGIVTVTYNSQNYLPDFINSLKKQVYQDYHLYVVDNASVDDSLLFWEEEKEIPVTIIKEDRNIGVAAGNNSGIKRAMEDDCSYILLLNNDIIVDENFLKDLYESALKGNDIVTCKMLYYPSDNVIWYAGGYIRSLLHFNHANHIGRLNKDSDKFSGMNEVTYTPTCCALIKCDIFHKVGIMDEKYFMYWDDTDFFMRVKKRTNTKVFYNGKIKLWHKIGSLNKSSAKYNIHYIRFYYRNWVYYLKKHNSLSLFIIIFPFLYAYIISRFFRDKKFDQNLSSFLVLNKAVISGIFY